VIDPANQERLLTLLPHRGDLPVDRKRDPVRRRNTLAVRRACLPRIAQARAASTTERAPQTSVPPVA
jgi:hypothetical protein